MCRYQIEHPTLIGAAMKGAGSFDTQDIGGTMKELRECGRRWRP